jgi:hypothetical protein
VADHDEDRPRRRLDLLALFAGIATLMMAGYVLTDGRTWLPNFDYRWLLAGGAVLVGLLLFGSSVRRRDR